MAQQATGTPGSPRTTISVHTPTSVWTKKVFFTPSWIRNNNGRLLQLIRSEPVVEPESFEPLTIQIQRTIEETRRIMADLRPSVLDDSGVVAATNWFCREFQKTYSCICVERQINVGEEDIPDSLKTPIFRIAQEALNNVAKPGRQPL
jgi:hypothetical protein